MKKLISLCLALCLVFGSIINTNAASYIVSNGVFKTPSTVELKDFKRLLEVAREVQSCDVKITNAQQIDSTTWAVRLQYDREKDRTADYIVTTLAYGWDNNSRKVISLPFDNTKDGTGKYGPNWYYFGLFSSDDHEICGFGLAERIKRWPSWNDLTFSGTTFSGKTYNGTYAQLCSEHFVEDLGIDLK